eukprot:TRINITY_DN32532_c0_g1_i1.p3 TRINITY_DN32532_c0_g1~~TRINITY_DN32532_c0_g1_i1.p3  ORF type:complete len:112 (-),score=1.10 TRINITY_DN32532_c0_g1_i1:6-341(-)
MLLRAERDANYLVLAHSVKPSLLLPLSRRSVLFALLSHRLHARPTAGRHVLRQTLPGEPYSRTLLPTLLGYQLVQPESRSRVAEQFAFCVNLLCLVQDELCSAFTGTLSTI